MKRPIPLLSCLVTLLCASELRAADAPGDHAAMAEDLFRQGRRLLDAQRYEEACAKLEESQRLDPGLGTQFHLAECQVGLGRIATAWALYREIDGAARAAGRTDRADLARRRAAEIEPRLARLRVLVPWADAAKGVSLVRRGRDGDLALGRGSWATAMPVDPGRYHIRAFADGRVPVDIESPPITDGVTVDVTVPEPPKAETQASGSGGTVRAVGWVTMGVGGVAMITSVVLGAVAKERYDASAAWCNAEGACTDQQGVDVRAEARALADVGTAFIVGGVIAIGTGLGLVLFAPKSRGIAVAPSFGGFVLRGSF